MKFDVLMVDQSNFVNIKILSDLGALENRGECRPREIKPQYYSFGASSENLAQSWKLKPILGPCLNLPCSVKGGGGIALMNTRYNQEL